MRNVSKMFFLGKLKESVEFLQGQRHTLSNQHDLKYCWILL